MWRHLLLTFTDFDRGRIPRRWGAREWEHTLVYYVRAGGWRLRGAGWGFSEEGTWLWHRHMPQGAPHTLPTLACPAVPYTVTGPAERWPHPWEPHSHRTNRGWEIKLGFHTNKIDLNKVIKQVDLWWKVWFFYCNILYSYSSSKNWGVGEDKSSKMYKTGFVAFLKLLPLTHSQRNSEWNIKSYPSNYLALWYLRLW